MPTLPVDRYQKNGLVGKKQKYFCNHCEKYFSAEKTRMAAQGMS
jgi:transposase-like protein